MSERISIRETARRLGVSDTAVHKAIKAGRVAVAGKTDSGRPLMDWEDTERRWKANSDVSKRSHVGPQGSARRAQDAPRVELPTSSRMDEAPDDGGDSIQSGDGPRSGRGAGYAQARAAREVFQAKLAKLEYEERTGKLVNADEVKVAWYKHITAAKTRIMGIPASCKSRYSDLPLAVVAVIDQVCREALEDLANGAG
jgi:hypothetical protein